MWQKHKEVSSVIWWPGLSCKRHFKGWVWLLSHWGSHVSIGSLLPCLFNVDRFKDRGSILQVLLEVHHWCFPPLQLLDQASQPATQYHHEHEVHLLACNNPDYSVGGGNQYLKFIFLCLSRGKTALNIQSTRIKLRKIVLKVSCIASQSLYVK